MTPSDSISRVMASARPGPSDRGGLTFLARAKMV